MKTILAFAGLLVSVNLMAADIYEFRGVWESRPAAAQQPKKTPPPQPVTSDQTVSPDQKPAASNGQVVHEDAVVSANDCPGGGHCNDH